MDPLIVQPKMSVAIRRRGFLKARNIPTSESGAPPTIDPTKEAAAVRVHFGEWRNLFYRADVVANVPPG